MWADRHSRAAGDMYLAGRGGVEPDRQQRAVIPAGSGTYRYAEIGIQPPAGWEAPPPRVEEPAPPRLVQVHSASSG